MDLDDILYAFDLLFHQTTIEDMDQSKKESVLFSRSWWFCTVNTPRDTAMNESNIIILVK